MTKTVTVTLEIDPKEYQGADDSDLGAVELAIEILRGQADFPDNVFTVQCGEAKQTHNFD